MTSAPVHVTRKRPTVAVLGTGIMGSGMARSLLRTGLGVRVWNRTQSKAAPLAADGATVTETAEEAVRGADVIVTMLNDGLSVAAALTAAASGVHGGQILLQSSTVGPDATADLAQRAADLGLVGLYAAHLAGQRPRAASPPAVGRVNRQDERPVALDQHRAAGWQRRRRGQLPAVLPTPVRIYASERCVRRLCG